MLCSKRFSTLREWGQACFLSVFALGPGFVRGRELVFFYAQTGSFSWLGILLCSMLYGLFIGLTVYFARRTAAVSFPQIFRRKMGVYAGGVVWTLHVLALTGMLWIALDRAGQVGETAFPAEHARLIGVLLSAALGICMIAGKNPAWPGMIAAGLLAAFLVALISAGKLPEEAGIYFHTKQRLENMGAALALGTIYACRGMAVTAGAASGFAAGVRPGRLAAGAGVCMCALLGGGNLIFRKIRQD